MNDAHGNDFLRTKFWEEHPAYQIRGGALNFGYDEVRNYVYRLIEEAVRRYYCDGIELDFQHFPTHFTDGTTEEKITKVNSLVKRVRTMVDAVGKERRKKLVMAARIPSDYGKSRLPGTKIPLKSAAITPAGPGRAGATFWSWPSSTSIAIISPSPRGNP